MKWVLCAGLLAGCPARELNEDQFVCAVLPCPIDSGFVDAGPPADTGAVPDADVMDVDVPDVDPAEAGFDAGDPPENCGNGIREPDEACDDGNRFSDDGCDGTCGSIDPDYQCFVPGEACVRWFSNAVVRIPIEISGQGSAVRPGHSVSLTFDHEALISTSTAILEDGDDLHIVRFVQGEPLERIDRVVDPESRWNRTDSRIWFALSSTITAFETSTEYYLFAGTTQATPAHADRAQVFRFFDDFEGTLVPGAYPGWSHTRGQSPTQETAPREAPGVDGLVLKAQNDPTRQSNPKKSILVRELQGNETTPNRHVTVWFLLPDDFSSSGAGQLAISQFCGTNCTGDRQLGGVSVDPDDATAGTWVSHRGAAIDSQLEFPLDGWVRLEYAVEIGAAVNRLHVWVDGVPLTQRPYPTSATREIDSIRLGIFWADDGTSTAFFDNYFERDFVAIEPSVSLGSALP